MNQIVLTETEMMQAALIGIARQVQNILANRSPAHGDGGNNDWQLHIEGAMGECAFAKDQNLYWNGSMGDLKADDVGPYQVRTTWNHNYRLIVHPNDPDDKIFVLVTGKNGTYYVRGWIWGREAKQDVFWADPTYGERPAYFVPAGQLNQMDIFRQALLWSVNKRTP